MKLLTTKCSMSLRPPTEDENAEFVMPAWIVGIEARTDASGDIHVNLDSSSPCWNDAIEAPLLELTEAPPHVFSKEDPKVTKNLISKAQFVSMLKVFAACVNF
jgi:hypothetical protein